MTQSRFWKMLSNWNAESQPKKVTGSPALIVMMGLRVKDRAVRGLETHRHLKKLLLGPQSPVTGGTGFAVSVQV